MERIELSKRGKNRGKYFATVDDEDYDDINKFNWYLLRGNNGLLYCATLMNGRPVLMHRYLTRALPGTIVDHKDGNLRLCSYVQNQYNQRKQCRVKTSRFKGVTWSSKRKKWIAQIQYQGKMFRFGGYISEEDAAITYNKAAQKLFGTFANTNNLSM